jgi:DNA-3-methyladenine glycosylase I
MDNSASSSGVTRCAWADSDDLMRAYHDEFWGNPVHDSQQLWAKLILDGFQAGLSWRTILVRQPAFEEAFQGFVPEVIATWGEADVERLLANPGIIRSRSKIQATIGNARAYLAMRANGEDFATFIWGLANHAVVYHSSGPIPASTPLSELVSKELKKRGFKFVGPVIVYAWLQACGIVNDHDETCFKRPALGSQAQ